MKKFITYQGRKSFLMASEGESSPKSVQGKTHIEGGAIYRLSLRCRKDSASDAPRGRLRIAWHNSSGDRTSRTYGSIVPETSDEWTSYEIEVPADDDTTSARASIDVTSGALWVDEIDLEKIGEAPFAFFPQRRIVVQADSSKSLNFTLKLRAGQKLSPSDAKVELSFDPVFTGGLGRLKKQELEANIEIRAQDEIQISSNLPEETPLGVYYLSVKMAGILDAAKGLGKTKIALFVWPRDRKPEYLTEDGTILVNGKPFFPIGLYHVKVEDYPAVSAKGFNCVQSIFTTDSDEFGRSLDEASKNGLMVDAVLYTSGISKEDALEIVHRFSHHPAVLSWKIMDEPDLLPSGADVEVGEAYLRLKEADRKHPLLITIARRGNYPFWATLCDIFQIDPYPLPEGALTLVADSTSAAKSCLEPWQNLTVVLQCGWTKDMRTQPTFEQARQMLRFAIENGAKGISWYSLHDPDWNLMNTPLWQSFSELNDETKQLAGKVLVDKGCLRSS